jgi:hypothetical protein
MRHWPDLYFVSFIALSGHPQTSAFSFLDKFINRIYENGSNIQADGYGSSFIQLNYALLMLPGGTLSTMQSASTIIPAIAPIHPPSTISTSYPSLRPSLAPTVAPSRKPSTKPSFQPTMRPTSSPTVNMDVYILDSTIFLLIFIVVVFLLWILTAPTRDSYTYPSDGNQRFIQSISQTCHYWADSIIQIFISCVSFFRISYSRNCNYQHIDEDKNREIQTVN